MVSREISPMSWSKQPLNSFLYLPEALILFNVMVLVVYLFKVKCGLSATGHRPIIIYGWDFFLSTAKVQSFLSLHNIFLRSEVSYIICIFSCMREKKDQHGNAQLPCVNYSWMSPCSSNFCFLLCMLGTAAGLVSTLSQLPGAWATIGLRVLHNYP